MSVADVVPDTVACIEVCDRLCHILVKITLVSGVGIIVD